MSDQRNRIILTAVLLLALAVLAGWILISRLNSQPENRLVNPGFEGEGESMTETIITAEGWRAFYCNEPYTTKPCWRRGKGHLGGLEMVTPVFQPTMAAALVHGDESAQEWRCDNETCWAGVYQTFPTTPGEVCEVGAWVRSWSALQPEQPLNPGAWRSSIKAPIEQDNSTWRIRVDPTGGTYAWASEIIASEPFGYEDGIYDSYAPISMTFVAASNQATVFFDNLRLWAYPHNQNTIDDAYVFCRKSPGVEAPSLPPMASEAPPQTKLEFGEFTFLGMVEGITAGRADDVIQIGNEFWLYYTNIGSEINLATSTNGLTWTPYEENPVFTPGAPGSWNHAWVQDATIIHDPETGGFEMWYQAAANEDLLTTGIGYATSSDGLHWTPVGDGPVIDQGLPGSWNEERIGGQAAIKIGETYYLYYTSTTLLPIFYRQIGCEVSLNGIDWTQCPGNPIMTPQTETIPFEGLELEEPSVRYHDGYWLMSYTGFLGPQGNEWRIGLAQSFDGLNWERLYTEPVVTWTDQEQPGTKSTMAPVIYLDFENDLLWLWYFDFQLNGLAVATAPITTQP